MELLPTFRQTFEFSSSEYNVMGRKNNHTRGPESQKVK
jgi:hypothetical protein